MDVKAVASLRRRWEAEENVWGFQAPSLRDLAGWTEDLFLVAEAEGAVVGFVHGVVRAGPALAVIPRGERYLDVEALYVVPEPCRRAVLLDTINVYD